MAVKDMQRKKTIRTCWLTVGTLNVRQGKISYPIYRVVEPFEEREHIAGCTGEETASKEECS